MLVDSFRRGFAFELLTGVFALVGEQLADLLTDFTVGNLDVVLGVAKIVHEGEETVVTDVQLQDCLR